MHWCIDDEFDDNFQVVGVNDQDDDSIRYFPSTMGEAEIDFGVNTFCND